MQNIRSLCVYCGSSGAVETRYREAASELGAQLARAGIEVVYGGGKVGLMGLLADAALAAKGKVTGIIPSHLRDAEVAHPGVSELVVVDSMHERKRQMAERADAESERNRPDADVPTQNPSCGERYELEHGADRPQRESLGGKTRHQAVARPRSQPGPDVEAHPEPGDEDPDHEQRDAGGE